MIYRLKRAVETQDEGLKVGSLCFSTNHGQRSPLDPIFVTSRADGYGYSTRVEESDIERSPQIKAADFKLYIEAIARGRVDLPNCEPIENVEVALSSLAASGGTVAFPNDVAHVRLPGEQHTRWARIFVDNTQMGGLSGRGVAILYRQQAGWVDPQNPALGMKLEAGPAMVRFAICKHEPKEGAGANHSRGWHPSHCPKCGLNMSVDSSD